MCQEDPLGWDQVLDQITFAYRCCPHTSTGESPYFLVYHRDPALPVHKLIQPHIPYRGNFDIGHEIQQGQIALTIAAKTLQKKRAAQKRPHEHRPSNHKFKVGDLVLILKHNKDKLELKWEPGYRITELKGKWGARVRSITNGASKRVNVRHLKLKHPYEDWELKPDSIGRAAKFINHPKNLPDIDLLPETDTQAEKGNQDRNNQTINKDSPKKYNLRTNPKPSNKLNL